MIESALLKSENRRYGISEENAQLIREQEGVIVARVPFDDTTAVLKCFEKDAFCREIENYGILQSCGIPTIVVLGKGERSILLEDIEASCEYRLGEESDLSKPAVIMAIAKWYKMLHTKVAQYVRQHGAGMYEEWDCFTIENIQAIKAKYNLMDNAGIQALEQRFEEVRKIPELINILTQKP